MPGPTAKTDPADYARALAFERASAAAVVARVEDLGWGTAYLEPALPLVYDENFIWTRAAGLDAGEAMRAADRVLAPLPHRRIVIDDEPTWQAASDRFARAGWRWETETVMAHRAEPDRPDPAVAVEEGPLAAILPAVEAYITSEPWGHHPQTCAELLEHHRRATLAMEVERCYLVRDNNVPVAYCKLWRRGAVAQVEDVVVLPDARGRGFGRAVVTAAVAATRTMDLELLFIVADDDDWPKELYAKLGFHSVGRLRIFDRRPQPADRRRPPA